MTTTLSLRDRIEKVVDKLVQDDEMFTLLDVSQLVKNDGGDWHSHTSMKPTIEAVLRDRFSSQLAFAYYTESPIDVNTAVGSQVARLFHPVGVDPRDYKNRSQQAIGPKPKTKVTRGKVGPGHPTQTGRAVKLDRKQQAQGYAEVPKAIWKKAKMRPNDVLVIEVHPGSLTILRKAKNAKHYAKACRSATKPNATTVTIPPSGRFRLKPKLLKEANLFGKLLDFCAYTDKAVVSRRP